MRLTKPNLAKLALPDGKAEARFFDETLPGFGVRVRAGGKRTWIVQYRAPAGQRTFTIGNVEVIEPDLARARAKEVLAKAQLGNDPQAEKAEARAKAALTMGPIVDTYLSRYAADVGRKQHADVTRYLNHSWRALHALPLDRIDRKTMAARLAAISAETGPVAANRARNALSTFFAWAMREGIADQNPVIGSNRAAIEVSRDHVLSDAELIMVWNACRDDDYGRAVRLLMLTGQRREEVGAMRWSEIDHDKALWSLPGSRTKNGRAHEIPLSAAALALISATPRRPDRDLVFGTAGPFSGWSKSKRSLDERIAAACTEAGRPQVASWRHHDLRRTAATRMAELGVQPHVIEAALNHASGQVSKVAAIYNRASYRNEKRQALDLWSAHVQALVAGRENNVVALRAKERA